MSDLCSELLVHHYQNVWPPRLQFHAINVRAVTHQEATIYMYAKTSFPMADSLRSSFRSFMARAPGTRALITVVITSNPFASHERTYYAPPPIPKNEWTLTFLSVAFAIAILKHSSTLLRPVLQNRWVWICLRRINIVVVIILWLGGAFRRFFIPRTLWTVWFSLRRPLRGKGRYRFVGWSTLHWFSKVWADVERWNLKHCVRMNCWGVSMCGWRVNGAFIANPLTEFLFVPFVYK